MNTRLIILSCCLFVLPACGNSSSPVTNNAAVHGNNPGQVTNIAWIDSARNFGRINEGQKLSVAFRFRNSGNAPLIIESVKPGCGCTVADFPKEPIAPGEESEITGIFDSHDREGLQHKEITVKANTAGTGEQTIYFDVYVVKKPGVPFSEEQ